MPRDCVRERIIDNNSQLRLAVLIDAENIGAQHIAGILERIEALDLGRIIEQRMYGNFLNPQLAAWVKVGESLRIIRRQNLANTRNAADFSLMVDAIELKFTAEPDGYCLVTGDRDFTILARHLCEEGFEVYGFGMRHTSKLFRRACSRFFRIDEVASERPPEPPDKPRWGMVVNAWN